MKSLTKAQRARLDKLATYLEGLPEDYRHFKMSTFCERSDEAEYARRNGGFNECGTVACAVGHGPAAGILVPPRFIDDEYVDWSGYGALFAPDENYVWDWCFETPWSEVDPHHWGAAARIRYLLDHGRPPEQYWFPNEAHRALYAPYRIDAKVASR